MSIADRIVNVAIQEHSFRRLTIDVECFVVSPGPLILNSENAAETAGRVVEAWVKAAQYGNRKYYDTIDNGINIRYLPDLILTHAAEWGLQ